MFQSEHITITKNAYDDIGVAPVALKHKLTSGSEPAGKKPRAKSGAKANKKPELEKIYPDKVASQASLKYNSHSKVPNDAVFIALMEQVPPEEKVKINDLLEIYYYLLSVFVTYVFRNRCGKSDSINLMKKQAEIKASVDEDDDTDADALRRSKVLNAIMFRNIGRAKGFCNFNFEYSTTNNMVHEFLNIQKDLYEIRESYRDNYHLGDKLWTEEYIENTMEIINEVLLVLTTDIIGVVRIVPPEINVLVQKHKNKIG